MATFNLAIGTGHTHFEISDPCFLSALQPKAISAQTSPQSIALQALENPVASEQFDVIFKDTKNLAIVVPDKTRNSGASLFLPILLGRIRDLGVLESKVRIILANGTHVGHSAEQIERIVGSEIAQRIQVIDHDCHDTDSLTRLGETKSGTPIFINRNILEADKVLVAGTAIHHYFAGFGGGPKMLNPGCAGYETISKNHALTIDPQSGWLHPGCRSGEIDSNPVQIDIADSLRFIPAHFLFETILSDSAQIVAAFAGNLVAAHRRACEMVDALYKVRITEKADLVIVSCGGYPKDINFIQAHKSLHNAFYAVKEGGVILALAECREGVGSQTFLEWFDCKDDELFRENLRRNYKVNGTTALALKMKTRSVKIVFVSSLPFELVTRLGLMPARTWAEGWSLAQKILPQNFKAHVMPYGSLTVPDLN